MIVERAARQLAADIFGILPIHISADIAKPLEEALTELEPVERFVLELRYGLKGDRSQTLHETSQRIGFTSREHIRQIQNKALRRLRHHTRHSKLTAYVIGSTAELRADRIERRGKQRNRQKRLAIKFYQMQDNIKELMKDGVVRHRKEMLESLGIKTKTWREVIFHRAITLLIEEGWIIRVAIGIYARGPKLETLESAVSEHARTIAKRLSELSTTPQLLTYLAEVLDKLDRILEALRRMEEKHDK